jgi:diguanylate cyclase (GGDEF)-like protein
VSEVPLRNGKFAVTRALRGVLNFGWVDRGLALTARISISDRLTAAFAAVAILAVAANLVVEHGTTTLVTITRPPAPPAIVVAPAPAPLPPAPPVAEPAPRSVHPIIDERPAIDALLDFERLIVRQSSAHDAQDLQTQQSAAKRLGSEVDGFLLSSTAPERGIRHRTATLTGDGAAMVHAALARRELANSYSAHFESLDAQMQKALDGSWKIFGRVIARQSLLAVNRALDEVRRRSSALAGDGPIERPKLSELNDAQGRLATALANNAEGLQGAQGSAWLAELHHNLDLLQQDTADLTALYDASTPTVDGFQASAQALEASLRSAAQIARDRDRRAAKAVTHHPSVVLPEQPALEMIHIDAVKRLVPALPLPVQAQDSGRTRAIIAGISIAVLLLVFVLCAATVRSIARPIRSFMKVTERLATGDLQVRFASCGVRELDVLAGAFNRMAEKLAVAQAATREHQAHLEFSVYERTRELQHLAEHDPLTGLPNRRQLLSHLEHALRTADNERSRVAVFFLDLDNFKNLNDSMGHGFGDQALKAIGQRLKEAAGQAGFAARLGGDEFTVIFAGSGEVHELTAVGETLVSAFQTPFLVEGRELLVSASVGASVYPDHERDSSALMRAADAALFQAKSLGRSRLSVFSRELLENASVKFRTEQALRRAVERGEWELVFQPEVRFDTQKVKLVEALVRWRLPDGRYAAPAEFMDVAEESGLIAAINEWVLRSAIERCAQWHHGPWPDARVAVNITATQLLDVRFVPQLLELLAEFRLPAACIEMELTETVLQTGPGTIQTLKKLREVGVSVALDDFGCGYSSLASLEQLPLTRVKLDRSLIASIDRSSRSLAIARAIIGLCANLELDVTAEGIERPEQLGLLLAFPNLTMQGYLVAQPLNAQAVMDFISRAPELLQSLLLEAPLEMNGPSPDDSLDSLSEASA